MAVAAAADAAGAALLALLARLCGAKEGGLGRCGPMVVRGVAASLSLAERG